MTEFGDKVKELNLPTNQFVVVGSGILDVLGIRKTNDIDLVVTPKLFDALKEHDDAVCETTPTGERVMSGEVEAWTTWRDYGDGSDMTIDELWPYVVVIDDVPYLSLEYTRKWKQDRGREKDQHDLVLIDEYTKDRL